MTDLIDVIENLKVWIPDVLGFDSIVGHFDLLGCSMEMFDRICTNNNTK